MKDKLLGLLLVALILLGSSEVFANNCGFRPFAPFGCENGTAVCVCDDDGCRWIWVNCG